MANDIFGNFTEAVWNAIRSQIRVGVIGRKESDGTTTVVVAGRPHYVYVRTGATNSGGEILEAFNRGAPRLAGMPVLLVKWNRVWNVIGVDSDSPALDSNGFSVAYHQHRRDNGLNQSVHDLDGMPSSIAGRAGALLRVNEDEDGYFLADADTGDIGVGDAINAAAAGTPLDADKHGYWDTANSLLKSITHVNLKALLKTYFDTLYVALTGAQTVAGEKTFTSPLTHGAGSWINMTDPDVAHGMTDILPTDQYGQIATVSGLTGGLLFFGFSDADATAFQLSGIIGTDTPTTPVILLSASKKSGTTAQALGATETVLALNTFLTRLLTVLGNGNVGIGTTAPQGKLHVHDGTSGKLFVTKTGVDGTAQTVIPDGTGDVTLTLRGQVIVKPSSGVSSSGDVSVVVGGSTNIYFGGGGTDVVVLAVSAGGAITVQRTAGSLTYVVTLDVIWQ